MESVALMWIFLHTSLSTQLSTLYLVARNGNSFKIHKEKQVINFLKFKTYKGELDYEGKEKSASGQLIQITKAYCSLSFIKWC